MQRKTRLILILLFIVLGVVLQVRLGIGSAWYLYVAAFILLVTHFLFGNVWAAFGMLKKGKMNEAEKLLDDIKRPDWLYKGHRAYYHFTRGMIAMQHKEYPDAEQALKTALQLGLRTANDKAITHLNLAHICFLQNRLIDSNTYLHQIKEQSTNDLVIKDKIKELEKALKARGVG